MKRSLYTAVAIILVLAALLPLSACGRKNTVEEEEYVSTGGEDLLVADAADRVFTLNSSSHYSLNPIIATNHANQLICDLVYENMLDLDNSFNVLPGILVEGSCNEDGTYWTFSMDLANPHYFHDGSEVTARDVRISLQYAVQSDRYAGRFSSFMGCSHDNDAGKIYVALGKGNTQFNKLMNIPVIKAGTYDSDHPIGSGPYTYNEDFTQLVAAETYPGYETLPVDTIYIKEYSSAADIISAFEDSYIDITINDPSSYTNLGYASTNENHDYATTNMHYVMFNSESTVCRYAAFRYAMAIAFDRNYLVDMLKGHGVAAACPMYPTCSLYPADIANSLRYDLDKCASILENAGVADYNEDGWREYMSGVPVAFRLRFIVCNDSSAKVGVANKFAADMEKIGVRVDVQPLVWDDYIKALEEGEFDMYYGEIRLRNDFDLTELFDPDSGLDKKTEIWHGINYSRSKDTSYADYINAYLASSDRTVAGNYATLCNYIAQESLLIPLGFENQQLISHRGICQGLNPNYGNPLYDFQNWTIDLSYTNTKKAKGGN